MQWLSEEQKQSSNLDYYVHIGNRTDSEINEYALVILFNWNQVPIINDKDVLFLKVKRGQESIIHSQLKMPGEKGIYDITPILIHNPYKVLNISNKRVETSIRTGIKVE